MSEDRFYKRAPELPKEVDVTGLVLGPNPTRLDRETAFEFPRKSGVVRDEPHLFKTEYVNVVA